MKCEDGKPNEHESGSPHKARLRIRDGEYSGNAEITD
jgi:hypothetical protein